MNGNFTPIMGLTGVDIEDNRACICDFTPILTFLHQGGRNFYNHRILRYFLRTFVFLVFDFRIEKR